MSANYDLIKNSTNAGTTAKSDQFIQLLQNNGKYVLKHANYYSVNDKKMISSINSTSSIPSTLSNAVIDFKIENGVVDVLQYPSLHMSFTNNTGSASTVVGSPLWINHIEVYAENGSKQIAYITGDDLYMQNFFLDRATYESQCSALGLTTSYASTATSIPNNGTLVLNLPIYHFFKAVGIAPCGLGSALLLRFYFNPTTLTHITGTALTCTNLQLVIRGKQLKQQEKNDLKALYGDNSRIPLSLTHPLVDRMLITQPLSANQVVPISLSGIRGVCSFLIFTVTLASDTVLPNGQINYVRMQDWDVLDASSKSLIGAFRRDNNIQEIDFSNNFGNNAWNQKQFHIMSWASAPREAFSTGAVSGFAVMSGNEKLSITCPSTLTSGSYVIEIKGYIHADIVLEKGSLRLERS